MANCAFCGDVAPTDRSLWPEFNLTAKKVRGALYKKHADPVFFKWQRGEATKQEWLDIIAKIKECVPDEVTP
jgi:hypothetical protein